MTYESTSLKSSLSPSIKSESVLIKINERINFPEYPYLHLAVVAFVFCIYL